MKAVILCVLFALFSACLAQTCLAQGVSDSSSVEYYNGCTVGLERPKDVQVCIVLLQNVTEDACEAIEDSNPDLILIPVKSSNVCIWPVPAPCSALATDVEGFLPICSKRLTQQISELAKEGQFDDALGEQASKRICGLQTRGRRNTVAWTEDPVALGSRVLAGSAIQS